jgi:molybdopterin converting factor small subunit
MKTKLHLYSGLQSYVNNKDIIEVVGATIRECLNSLVAQFPDIRHVLFNKEGKLLPNVMVSINLNSSTSEKLEKSIRPGDEIYLIMVIAGG